MSGEPLPFEAVAAAWDARALPALREFITIPAKSPHFDAHWAENGYLDEAVELGASFCRRELPDADVDIVRLEGRTPVLYVDAPGSVSDGATVLIYGHLDKQPEAEGWSDGLAPWRPVVRDGKLYGRGAVDDGYALFSAVTALATLREAGVSTPRCIFLLECCEESGSFDLPAYLDVLAERIGEPDLVVVPDAGCGSYDRLWCTTSLRGMITGELRVDVLRDGVHSGDAGGIVPSSFRILRSLLSRLEGEGDGRIRLASCRATIPALRREQAAHAGGVLGGATRERYPFLDGVEPVSADPAERILDRTWRPALEVTGADGLPLPECAGNVLRPFTAVKLALRLPPTVDAGEAAESLRALFESEPPHGARVRFEPDTAASGWAEPEPPPWLAEALESASRYYFGAPPVHMGEGGTIPLMAWLAERFPKARYLVTGAAGPGSNSHGPDEFLHLDAARRLTGCLGEVLRRCLHKGLQTPRRKVP